MRPEIVVASRAALADVFASVVEKAAARSIEARGRFVMALTGGSAARALYPGLVPVELDWERTHLLWGDERAVPPDSAESNFGLAAELWLRPATAPAASVTRMPAEEADLEAAAARYARELARLCGEPPLVDLVHLGVGPDGHVASLFPGHALLGEERRHVAPVYDSPKPPPRRLTLTLPVLGSAATVVVTALGGEKVQVMAGALRDPASELPVARVLRLAKRALVLLDPEAAGPRPR